MGGGYSGVKALTGLLSSVIAVRLLGAVSYGQFVALYSVFILYLALNSSISTVLVTRIIRTTASGERLDELLSAANVLTATAIGLLGGITILLYSTAARIFLNGPYDSSSTPAFKQAILMMGILTAIQIVIALYSAIIEGYGRLDLSLSSQLFGPAAINIILILAYFLNFPISINSYVGTVALGSCIDLYMLGRVKHKVIPSATSLRLTKKIFDDIWRLIKSGTALHAATLMGIFLEPLNKVLLNYFVGPIAVTGYDLCMKLIWGIQSLFAGGMRVFLHQSAEGSQTICRNNNRVVTIVMVPVIVAHILAGVLLEWMSNQWVVLGNSTQIMIFFAVATASNLGMIFITPAYMSLMGCGDYRFILRSQMIVAFTNALVSLVLIPTLGLIGAVFGLLVATAFNVVAIYYRHEKVFGTGLEISAAIRHDSFRIAISSLLFAIMIASGMRENFNYYVAGFTIVALAFLMKEEKLTKIIVSMADRRK